MHQCLDVVGGLARNSLAHFAETSEQYLAPQVIVDRHLVGLQHVERLVQTLQVLVQIFDAVQLDVANLVDRFVHLAIKVLAVQVVPHLKRRLRVAFSIAFNRVAALASDEAPNEHVLLQFGLAGRLWSREDILVQEALLADREQITLHVLLEPRPVLSVEAADFDVQLVLGRQVG